MDSLIFSFLWNNPVVLLSALVVAVCSIYLFSTSGSAASREEKLGSKQVKCGHKQNESKIDVKEIFV